MRSADTLARETDEALAGRARGGELGAQTLLIQRLYPGVHTLAVRLLHSMEAARDATQETFLRAFSHLEQYDGTYRFSAWVFRILVNFIRDQRRRGRRMITVDLMPDDWPAREPVPVDAAIRGETLDRVRTELDLLPEDMRLALLLHFQEGLSGKEVAYALGITHQAARLKICRAVAKLRERLGEDS